ncbi:hypothetical protein B0O99DRAFT_684331 [Bisporella sp. PMI_857]|nr:hypothetical protein B0O99DRAFT_684331 [Bisporella sp. PMI_857]
MGNIFPQHTFQAPLLEILTQLHPAKRQRLGGEATADLPSSRATGSVGNTLQDSHGNSFDSVHTVQPVSRSLIQAADGLRTDLIAKNTLGYTALPGSALSVSLTPSQSMRSYSFSASISRTAAQTVFVPQAATLSNTSQVLGPWAIARSMTARNPNPHKCLECRKQHRACEYDPENSRCVSERKCLVPSENPPLYCEAADMYERDEAQYQKDKDDRERSISDYHARGGYVEMNAKLGPGRPSLTKAALLAKPQGGLEDYNEFRDYDEGYANNAFSRS